jgi:hypothetical protein
MISCRGGVTFMSTQKDEDSGSPHQKPQAPHGGRRAGSGRHKMAEQDKQQSTVISIRFHPGTIARLQKFGYDGTAHSGLRRLVQMFLPRNGNGGKKNGNGGKTNGGSRRDPSQAEGK